MSVNPIKIIDNFAQQLSAPYGKERSCKFFARELLDQRFLISCSKNAIGFRPHKQIQDLLHNLNVDSPPIEDIRSLLKQSRHIHLGYEASSKQTFKLYFEFDSDSPNYNQGLQFLAFKWPMSENIRAQPKTEISRYLRINNCSNQDLNRRIKTFFTNSEQSRAYQFCRQILHRYQEQSLPVPLFLEVSEIDNPRSSFDVRLYDAQIKLADIYSELNDLANYWQIKPEKFYNFFDQHQHQILGHISAGIDRNTREFTTIYFGATQQ